MRFGKLCSVTTVPVDVLATIYPSAEARLITLTICDDKERVAAWRLPDMPGPGVRLHIGRDSGSAARIQAVLQSVGLGSAEMLAIGQPGGDALTTWVRCSLTEKAWWYPCGREM